uniref:Transposon protein n=1 Tax=Arundo donax TaxID=35708 RepID=A0A0A9GIG5_ARUDO
MQGRQREAGVIGTETDTSLGAARVRGSFPASDRQHSRPGESLGIVNGFCCQWRRETAPPSSLLSPYW